MASIGFLIGGALVNALAFTGSNFLQRAQVEWAMKRQERLDYINNEIMKEHKAEKRFSDLNTTMQQYFLVTGRQLEPYRLSLIFTYYLKTITIVNLHL